MNKIIEKVNIQSWEKRLVEEYVQLCERLEKLSSAFQNEGFYEKVGHVQYDAMLKQEEAMKNYAEALEIR